MDIKELRKSVDAKVLTGVPLRQQRGKRPPRNSPCPCNSGKKSKNCCAYGVVQYVPPRRKGALPQ